MAEFLLVPNVLDTNDSEALLFFCNQVLIEKSEEEADLRVESSEKHADLKEKFESITKKLSQIPVFVLDRSQTFEHKQRRTGIGLHSHVRDRMLAELALLLPPELRVKEMKDDAAAMLQREYCMRCAFDEASTGPLEQTFSSAITTGQLPIQYMQCKKAPEQPQSQHLEACFIHLPSCDTLEVHYFVLNVRPKPKGRFSLPFNKEETLEVDGNRSIRKFSMIRSTAMEVVSQQGGDVREEIKAFYQKARKYKPLSLPTPDPNGADVAQALESGTDGIGSQQQEPTQSSSSQMGQVDGDNAEKRGQNKRGGGSFQSQNLSQDGSPQSDPLGNKESSVDPEE